MTPSLAVSFTLSLLAVAPSPSVSLWAAHLFYFHFTCFQKTLPTFVGLVPNVPKDTIKLVHLYWKDVLFKSNTGRY